MKYTFILIILSVITLTAYAQDDETQYLFELKDISVSGFGGVILEYTTIDGSFGLLTGGGGAVILNQTFYIGGFGCGLTTDHEWPAIYPDDHTPVNPQPPKYTNMSLNLGYGGLWLGYLNQSHKLVHWGINAKIGGGNISLIDRDYYIDESDLVADDNIFVFIPTIEAEVNLARWFKVSGGVGYRFIGALDNRTFIDESGTEQKYYETNDISTPTVFLSFMFGGFGKR